MTMEILIFESLFSQTLPKLTTLEIRLLKAKQIHDLTINEIHVIQNIGINLKKTMSEISRCLKITPGALTPVIDRLVRKGYVSRGHGEEDRRIVYVELTSKGAFVYKEYAKIHSELTRQILNFLTLEEGMALFKTLDKFNQFLDGRMNFEAHGDNPESL